ncbi:MAG: hypothetical protein AB7H90_01335 [Alphaproteobacteria bacterium]
MTPETLRRIGEILWGERWFTALATALGVSQRTVRRWASGTYPVPHEWHAPILRLVAEGIERIDEQRAELAELYRALSGER